MPANFRFGLFGALLVILASGTSLGENAAPTPEALIGQYAIGQGSGLTVLSLLPEGRFIMRSGENLGEQAGRTVQGTWKIEATEVVLRMMQPGHPFLWRFRAIAHANGFDLVPAELSVLYQQTPWNPGTRYRRFAGPSQDDERILARTGAPLRTAANQNRQVSDPDSTPKRKHSIAADRTVSVRTESKRSEPSKEPVHAEPARPQLVSAEEFVIKPAPTEEVDVRSLRSPGLARLSVDARGRVTKVTIIESTGVRQFDSDAADLLRRWRTPAGPPREVEIPLTSVRNGKRSRVVVPLSTGSMSSG